MKKEYWKDIVNYENYQVSNLGRVRSLYNNKGQYRIKILNPIIGNGYYRVRLFKNKKNKLYSVHRLVAEAFIHNPDNLPCINHKDENRLNNIVENLEFCTHKYNSNYGTAIKRTINKISKKVYQYTLDGELVKIYNSVKECEQYNFKHSGISACCRGDKYRKTYKGYIWRY